MAEAITGTASEHGRTRVQVVVLNPLDGQARELEIRTIWVQATGAQGKPMRKKNFVNRYVNHKFSAMMWSLRASCRTTRSKMVW